MVPPLRRTAPRIKYHRVFQVLLTWRPPKATNGKINGYIIHYTTNRRSHVRDWFVEGVVGDVTSARISNLSPDKKYYFKVSARNSKGYGPYSSIVSFVTPPGSGSVVPTSQSNPDGKHTSQRYELLI